MKTRYAQLLLGSNAGLGMAALRIPVGVVFIAHGAQKLFGWFGGYGLEGTGQWMASIGLEPGYFMALLAGSAEFFGGIALLLGLLTRPAALVTAVTMIVALFSTHFANGLFLANNGYEYALVLFAASLALVFEGAGAVSLDTRILQWVQARGVGQSSLIHRGVAA